MPFVSFDSQASVPGNLIVDEPIPLRAVSPGGHLFVIPLYAPFFEKDLAISHVSPTGVVTPMNLGEHYLLGYKFMRGQNATQKPVWGAISLLDNQLAGSLRVTYRSLGAGFHQTTSWIQEALANQLYSPRVTAWDQVANVPAQLPPAPHPWDVSEDVGILEVVAAIDSLNYGISNKNNSIIQLGVVLSSNESSLQAGASTAHLPITHNQRILGLSFSLSTAASSGTIQVMPTRNGVDLLSSAVSIAQGVQYQRVNLTNHPLVNANLAEQDIISARVLTGQAGVGAKGLTMSLETQYLPAA